MTQKCQHDEQLLDYVYGELSDAERKIFADHLVTCTTCPAQVQSFGNIRQEFQQRPAIEPAGEAMQRMTALLMQAAAAEHGKAAATAADGGGKVLAFRARGLRRILFHPASSVMAVAAAALFWVVFHAPPISRVGAVGAKLTDFVRAAAALAGRGFTRRYRAPTSGAGERRTTPRSRGARR